MNTPIAFRILLHIVIAIDHLPNEVRLSETGIGSRSFEKVWSMRNLFVDKSLFIKKFLELRNPVHEMHFRDPKEYYNSLPTKTYDRVISPVVFSLFPHNFGKTVIMDMVGKFLNIEVDENGFPLSLEKRQFRKYFCGDQDVQPMKIANETITMHVKYFDTPVPACDLQGTYPVIRVDFKYVNGSSYETTLQGIRSALRDTFHQHLYMVNVLKSKLQGVSQEWPDSKQDLELFQRLYNKEASEVELTKSLKFLAKILRKHFQRKVFVFIDEFNTPFYETSIKGAGNKISDEGLSAMYKILNFFGSIFGNIFDASPDLFMGFVTGISGIGRDHYFPAKSHEYSYYLKIDFLCHEFSHYYGFSEEEVKCLLNLNNAPEVNINETRNYYNGHNIALQKVYNTWSISKFIDGKCKFRRYWNESDIITGLIGHLYRADNYRTDFLSLLYTGKLMGYPGMLEFLEVYEIRDVKIITELDTTDRYDTFMFLVYNGYLSLENLFDRKSEYFRIPNYDIRGIFQKALIKFCAQFYGFNFIIRDEFVKKVKRMLVLEPEDRADAGQAFAEEYLQYLETKTFSRYKEDAVKCTLLAIIESFGDERVKFGPAPPGFYDSGSSANAYTIYKGCGVIFQFRWKGKVTEEDVANPYFFQFIDEVRYIIVIRVHVVKSATNMKPVAVNVQSVSFRNLDEDREKYCNGGLPYLPSLGST